MKKIVLSVCVVIAFVIYAFTQKGASPNALSALNSNPSGTTTNVSNFTDASQSTGSSAPPVPNPSPGPARVNPTPAPTPSPKPVVTGGYKDGTYTGSSVDAFYGNVQVSATISGGRLTNVGFLDYPQDRGQSREINSMSLPQLKQEAIAAQSANVNTVSGATQTSRAFRQSLADALIQAKS